MTTKVLEQFFRLAIPCFLILVFVTCLANSYALYLEHQPFQYGDWLINYQGGFVRRGFSGEIIFQLAKITHLNPGFIVFMCHFILYGVILFYSYRLLKLQKSVLPFIFLIFSPFIFNFPIYDRGGGFRKEIMYLALLCILAYKAKTTTPDAFRKNFLGALLIYPFLVLSHESLICFLPYLFAVYFLKLGHIQVDKHKDLQIILLAAALSLIAFGWIIVGGRVITQEQIQKIYTSLNLLKYPIYSPNWGSIFTLTFNFSTELKTVLRIIKESHYFWYSIVILLAAVAYLPLRKRIKIMVSQKKILFCILLSVCFSLPLFIIGLDWGRWLYIHFFSSFILLMLIEPENEEMKYNNLKIWPLILLSLLLYSSIWYVPHCYPSNIFILRDIKNLPKIQYERYLKPISQFLENFSHL